VLKSALVAAIVVERPLCGECIGETASISVAEVHEYLKSFRDCVLVYAREDRCRACREQKTVFSLVRP